MHVYFNPPVTAIQLSHNDDEVKCFIVFLLCAVFVSGGEDSR